jgi:hypothetical protein
MVNQKARHLALVYWHNPGYHKLKIPYRACVDARTLAFHNNLWRKACVVCMRPPPRHLHAQTANTFSWCGVVDCAIAGGCLIHSLRPGLQEIGSSQDVGRDFETV